MTLRRAAALFGRIGLWTCLGVLTGWALVRGLGLDSATPLAQLVAYTPYAALGPPVLTAAALLGRRWRAAVVAGGLALCFAAFVVPRVAPAADPADGVALRIASANLYVGAASADDVVALVRRERPDVLALQELTPEAVARLDAAGLGRLLPYRALRSHPGAGGTGLYARYPLDAARGLDRRTTFDQVTASLRLPTGAVDVVSAHPAPPLPGRTDRWVRDLGLVPPAPRSGPVRVLAGDFNASLDHAPLRRVLATGYRDAADDVGRGWMPTWPTDDGRLPPVTIDHVLVDDRAGAQAFRTSVLRGTDHRAVVAVLVLPR